MGYSNRLALGKCTVFKFADGRAESGMSRAKSGRTASVYNSRQGHPGRCLTNPLPNSRSNIQHLPGSVDIPGLDLGKQLDQGSRLELKTGPGR